MSAPPRGWGMRRLSPSLAVRALWTRRAFGDAAWLKALAGDVVGVWGTAPRGAQETNVLGTQCTVRMAVLRGHAPDAVPHAVWHARDVADAGLDMPCDADAWAREGALPPQCLPRLRVSPDGTPSLERVQLWEDACTDATGGDDGGAPGGACLPSVAPLHLAYGGRVVWWRGGAGVRDADAGVEHALWTDALACAAAAAEGRAPAQGAASRLRGVVFTWFGSEEDAAVVPGAVDVPAGHALEDMVHAPDILTLPTVAMPWEWQEGVQLGSRRRAAIVLLPDANPPPPSPPPPPPHAQ